MLLLASTAAAQWNPPNPVNSDEKQTDGVLLRMQTGLLRLRVCSDSIVRILYTPTSSFPTVKHYAVIKTSWPATRFSLESTATDVSLNTARLKVTVARKDGSIVFSDLAGKKLVQLNGRNHDARHGQRREDLSRGRHYLHLRLRGGLYGLGQHQAGVWNYRGESVDISQDNTNISRSHAGFEQRLWDFLEQSITQPLQQSLLHSLYISSEVADTIDYYFLYGPDFDKIVAGYRELTGAAPMFGKWAYGFWQCKNRYKSQEEMLDVAHKYRELHIPVDNIVQDWFWWNHKGEHVFNKNIPIRRAWSTICTRTIST